MPQPPSHSRETFLKRFLEVERPLRAYLYSVTRDVHDTEDLVQIVGQELWTKDEAYDPARPFIAWTLGMARLVALRWRRSKARSPLVVSEEAIEWLAAETEAHAEAINRRHLMLGECIEELPEKWRKPLRWKYFDGLSHREIAERLQRRVSAVDMLLSRIRQRLRDCVEAKWAQEECTP